MMFQSSIYQYHIHSGKEVLHRIMFKAIAVPLKQEWSITGTCQCHQGKTLHLIQIKIAFFKQKLFFRMYTSSSGAHSRASSLAEEVDGYVSMQPPNMDVMDDYMNMVPKTHSSTLQNEAMSSATSSCSITSGTPSTDIRFSEYHLEKMTSRFTPDEDENQIQGHLRTYSVGSKLEHKRKHIERVTDHTNPRVRAFSVGSRVKVPRAELNTRLTNQLPTSVHQEINNNTNHAVKGKKSSSAPLLNHSKAAHGGSFDPMEDLMEIDYSCKSDDSVNSRQQAKQSLPMPVPSKKNDDYMNMNGRSRNNSTTSNYVDMKPGTKTNDYLDMRPGAAFKYSNSSTSLSSSPVKSSSTPKTSNFR